MPRFLVFVVILLVVPIVSFSFSVGLMITGEVGGNAIYEMMVSGANKASEDFGIEVRVVEGGYNAARWEPLLTSLVASGMYDLVITFTEGMPHSVRKVASAFPAQKIALIDGIAQPLPNIFSLGFNDEEMAYLAGVYAALMVQAKGLSIGEPTIGLLAGDIYPAMTDRMKPGYERGAASIIPHIRVLFSVAGSWGDPNKGRELARAQFDQGASVILSIAGGTGVGAIHAAKEKGRFIIGVDSNYIHLAPDVILACVLKHADDAIYDVIKRAWEGTLPFGSNERWGVTQGGIGFPFDDPFLLAHTPDEVLEKMRHIWQQLFDNEIQPLG